MRVRPLENQEASYSMRLLFAIMKRMVGKVLTPNRVQAHCPGIAWGGTVMTAALEFAKKTDSSLKHMIALRVAQIVGCPF